MVKSVIMLFVVICNIAILLEFMFTVLIIDLVVLCNARTSSLFADPPCKLFTVFGKFIIVGQLLLGTDTLINLYLPSLY